MGDKAKQPAKKTIVLNGFKFTHDEIVNGTVRRNGVDQVICAPAANAQLAQPIGFKANG